MRFITFIMMMCVYALFYLDRTESAALINGNSLGDGDEDGDEDDADEIGRADTKETNLVLHGNDATQHRWKKCAALKESQADITTQEEFYKFDFQVMLSQNSSTQFNLIFATMLSFSLNFN